MLSRLLFEEAGAFFMDFITRQNTFYVDDLCA